MSSANKKKATTVFVAISGHGYGHLSQTAPVVEALQHRFPESTILIASDLSEQMVSRSIRCAFQYEGELGDVGVANLDAFRVDVPNTLRACRSYLGQWQANVSRQMRRLKERQVDLVLSNVACIPLQAARRLGIPNIALCSLNWAGILASYIDRGHELDRLVDLMRQTYRQADRFIQPTPSMPMPDLRNTVSVGPIARLGQKLHHQISARLGLQRGKRMVMLNLGGIATPLQLHHWPQHPGLAWLVPDDWYVQRPDMFRVSALDLDFLDVMTSCDALVTKPGYGNLVTAVCNDIPVLYVPRPDWPEAAVLIHWLQRMGNCACVSETDLRAGQLGSALESLWQQPQKAPLSASGAHQAVDIMLEYL